MLSRRNRTAAERIVGRPCSGVWKFTDDGLNRLLDAVREARVAQKPAPAAWRVKDFADGWILFASEADARAAAKGAGSHVEPLYAHPEAE